MLAIRGEQIRYCHAHVRARLLGSCPGSVHRLGPWPPGSVSCVPLVPRRPGPCPGSALPEEKVKDKRGHAQGCWSTVLPPCACSGPGRHQRVVRSTHQYKSVPVIGRNQHHTLALPHLSITHCIRRRGPLQCVHARVTDACAGARSVTLFIDPFSTVQKRESLTAAAG